MWWEMGKKVFSSLSPGLHAVKQNGQESLQCNVALRAEDTEGPTYKAEIPPQQACTKLAEFEGREAIVSWIRFSLKHHFPSGQK